MLKEQELQIREEAFFDKELAKPKNAYFDMIIVAMIRDRHTSSRLSVSFTTCEHFRL